MCWSCIDAASSDFKFWPREREYPGNVAPDDDVVAGVEDADDDDGKVQDPTPARVSKHRVPYLIRIFVIFKNLKLIKIHINNLNHIKC